MIVNFTYGLRGLAQKVLVEELLVDGCHNYQIITGTSV